MPERRQQPTPGDAVERVSRSWNALVAGQPLPDNLEPSFAATMQRLHAVAGNPTPAPEFVSRLREDLVHAAAAAIPLSTVAEPSRNGHALASRSPLPGDGSREQRAPSGHVLPFARWSSLTRRMLTNVAATAALLAIVLISVVVTLRLGPLATRDHAELPLVPGPGIIDEKLLLRAQFDRFPEGLLSIGVLRWVLQPGAEVLAGSRGAFGEGPSAYLIESGTLTVSPAGSIAVEQAGANALVPVTQGAQIALQAGDRGFAPSGVTSLWRNDGTEPVRVLESFIGYWDAPPSVAGVLRYTVVEDDFAGSDSPVEITVFQATLQPGADLPADAVTGMQMLKVESGRLVAVDVDGDGNLLPPVELGQATHFLNSFPPGRVFRSGNDEPVSLLLVTVTDANPLGPSG
jgi:hypothetical protein